MGMFKAWKNKPPALAGLISDQGLMIKVLNVMFRPVFEIKENNVFDLEMHSARFGRIIEFWKNFHGAVVLPMLKTGTADPILARMTEDAFAVLVYGAIDYSAAWRLFNFDAASVSAPATADDVRMCQTLVMALSDFMSDDSLGYPDILLNYLKTKQ